TLGRRCAEASIASAGPSIRRAHVTGCCCRAARRGQEEIGARRPGAVRGLYPTLCPVMGWTRRGPAPPSRIAGSGLQNQEHSMPRTINRLEAVATIGIDIGKNTFHLVGLDRNGAIVLRQKLSRRQVEARLANMPPCLIGMEACVGAHHLSRQLKA